MQVLEAFPTFFQQPASLYFDVSGILETSKCHLQGGVHLDVLRILKTSKFFWTDLQPLWLPVNQQCRKSNSHHSQPRASLAKEHPEITEKISLDAVVFMKVAGDEKFNLWSERQAKKQAKKGAPLISVTVKKMGPSSFAN